jgi:outer membrane protein assembly factor BamD
MIAIVLSCSSPGVKNAATAEEQFLLAKKELDKKHYLRAIEGFQKAVFNFPGATVVDTAQYYLALSYYENKEYELAAAEFQRLTINYPQSDYTDDAKYYSGLCYFRNTPGNYALDQEDLKQAIAAMEDFIIDSPDSPLLEDAKNIILQAKTELAHKEYENGILYFKLEDYRAALIYFQMVIDDYTDTEYATKAIFKMAEIAYKQKKYIEAQEKYNNFLTLYPSDKLAPKAKEHLAKIAQKLNDANASDSI